jgi:thiol-disulfide isomerase/thioredoxin
VNLLQSIQLGPLGLSVSLLVAFGAVGLGWFAAMRLPRRNGAETESLLYAMLGASLLASRISFVLRNASGYAHAPLSMLDIRDGGWDPVAGVVGAALVIAVVAWRRRAAWQPLAIGLATAAGVWLTAGLVAALLESSGPRLPAVTLAGLDGQPVALAQFRGKPIVLNLWATWCPPCIRELPVLVEAQRQRADVHFVFVDQGEPPARVSAFLAGRGLDPRNVVLDAGAQVAKELGARALPTTLFFDAQGQLAAVRVGELSAGTLSERLRAVGVP